MAISPEDVKWKGTRLFYGRQCVRQIVADEKWPGMWRVRHSDGRLSDMVNLTRAKDAAAAGARRLIEHRRKRRGVAADAFAERVATLVAQGRK